MPKINPDDENMEYDMPPLRITYQLPPQSMHRGVGIGKIESVQERAMKPWREKLIERLAKKVRTTWIAWAETQPDIADHPNWLTPWEELSERDQQVDREIARAIEKEIRTWMAEEEMRRLQQD